MPEGHTALVPQFQVQRDLDKLETRANRSIVNFNKKCKVLHLERKSSRHQGVPRPPKWKTVWLGGHQDDQQYALAAKKVNGITVCTASRLREDILALYSTLVRPRLEYRIQFWAPHIGGDRER